MNIKYAVFDFDGTLFDSMFIWQVLAKKYLKSKGKVPKASLMQSINRLNLPDAAKFIKNQYLPDLSEDEILKEINNTAEELYLSSAKPKCCRRSPKMTANILTFYPAVRTIRSVLRRANLPETASFRPTVKYF